MINEEFKHSTITSKIIGVAMEVHRELGFGFQEKIYQRALAYEFGKRQIKFSREHQMDIYYKGLIIGNRLVDFFIEDLVILEIKAVSHLENSHLAQALNYLDVMKLDVGLLINFGGSKLEFKRLMKSPKRHK